MSMSGLKHVSEGPRRFDVFTGAGRRRRFTRAEKAAIVEESYAGGDTVCGVARRHGLTPRQLFGWRRLARVEPAHSAERSLFVPVIVSPEPEPEPLCKGGPSPGSGSRGRRRRTGAASIEFEVGGVVVRVGRDADAGAIAAVIGALKAAS